MYLKLFRDREFQIIPDVSREPASRDARLGVRTPLIEPRDRSPIPSMDRSFLIKRRDLEIIAVEIKEPLLATIRGRKRTLSDRYFYAARYCNNTTVAAITFVSGASRDAISPKDSDGSKGRLRLLFLIRPTRISLSLFHSFFPCFRCRFAQTKQY